MANQLNTLLGLAGFTIQGDFGPVTTYTKRSIKKRGGKRGQHTKVFFPKIWLADPTSQLQQQHRDRIRSAARVWKLLCPCFRKRWERATKKLALHLNGYNLFCFWFLTGDDDKIATIERQSKIQLQPIFFASDYRCATCKD